ncbi:uncharacterized protein LTR77_005563 [Saxophila tyrrhenica]|uniref:DNA repair protein rad9 n=1 Tax=Saxophila tyrrhenica TaxID=1690608 RepID=A0AAV9P932_9PEZI|nr:hypothetical protein LTR77_005563 [Saxophila tyrrhenica]
MANLNFSLSSEATGRVYELLVCLAKFGETVAIEARGEKVRNTTVDVYSNLTRVQLTFTALNLSRTAYASFALDSRSFFINYEFQGSGAAKDGDRFTCQILNKALQSVFKGRANDSRGRESAVERCDVSVQDQPDKAECRLVVKMLCKHGMTKTYRLTYEPVEVMHALFDRTAASQGWKISARVLREYIEYFGPKTEQLDLLAAEGKAIFTSFTEKVQDGKEVLKQPLETAISLHTEDFEDFHMQENMHIVISVKDFKAIVTHADTLRTTINAHFSFPTRPLQFSYQSFGIYCEFTLMTTGDYRGASSTPNPNFVTNRSSSRQPSTTPAVAPSRSASEMPPPARPVPNKPPPASQSQRLSLKESMRQAPATRPETDPHPDSLFMPGGDDQVWNPPNYDEEEEMLGWDANNEDPSANFHPTFRDSGSAAQSSRGVQPSAHASQEGLEPTQRLSQLHGMFD